METKTDKVKQFKEIAEQLEQHFDNRAEIYSDGLKAVDWKSREAQYNRFEQLLKVVDVSSTFSILDYGCGDGEFINFLNARNLQFKYYGFDVSTQMLEKANKSHADSVNCHFTNEINELPTVDYVIASGVFAMKFDFSETEWKEYIIEKVTQFNQFSNKGFAFNCLTSYSDIEFQRADLYYADPLFWFDYCKKNVSRYVSLLHDYPEYDFTVIVRK